MSDPGSGLLRREAGVDLADVQTGAEPADRTAGQMLKQARLRSGLTLEELGARVKVTVARLQAMEEDRIEAWPNINVLRAAASGVCRHVQLDPAVILDRLPKAEKIQLTGAGPEAQVGFRDRGGFTLRRTEGTGRGPYVMVAAALLLITALIYSGPSLWAWAEHLFERNVAAPALLVAGSVTDPILPPDAGPTDTRVGVSKAESIAPVALVPALPSSSPAESQVPLVVVKAKGLTWIAVSDANGVTLLRKTLSAGQSASASGALPLWVVVGKADNAEVSVRGEAVTLQPSVPDNVARFKVQ